MSSRYQLHEIDHELQENFLTYDFVGSKYYYMHHSSSHISGSGRITDNFGFKYVVRVNKYVRKPYTGYIQIPRSYNIYSKNKLTDSEVKQSVVKLILSTET